MMYIFLFTILGLFLPASAWLPGKHKSIVSRDGTDLFNSTPGYLRAGSKTKRKIPASGKIRGVNLGAMFVFEPWLATSVWSDMGCGSYESEFGCVAGLGQDKANTVFQAHWGAFITEDDFSQMESYGLNTVRIPVGYWMEESLVYDSEYFPQGGITYLEQVCAWASDAGFYIIIDMHGAPGAQVADNSDTGQYASTPGFYADFQYDRGTNFLSWLTNKIFTSNSFRNVGMLGIVNEPVVDSSITATMISSFYPDAYNAIRTIESGLGISEDNQLHIQMMDARWGAGNPAQDLTNTQFLAYDDHRYLAFSTDIEATHSNFLSISCSDDLSNGDIPTVVGEFSLAVPPQASGDDWDPDTQQTFYAKWFAAQVTSYENHTLGWIFWTWKTQIQDYRWSYQQAVEAGVVPEDLDTVYDLDACEGY